MKLFKWIRMMCSPKVETTLADIRRNIMMQGLNAWLPGKAQVFTKGGVRDA